MLRFTILVVFAPYFSWEIPIFAPFLPPIFAKNAPYSALYLSVLAPYQNVVSMPIPCRGHRTAAGRNVPCEE